MPLDRRQILELLDLARWAPSGDNTQPWRFELLDEGGLRVHGSDTEAHCVYDYKGLPSRMAHGALLETLAIAAAAKGYAMQFATASDGGSGHTAIYDIRFIEADAVVEQGLFDSIRKRTVNRRPMSLSPLTRAEREALEKSAGSQYQLHWIQAFAERLRFARLLYQSAHIRLTIPEAFEVHRSVIEWGARFSNDRIPDRAVGLDPVATRLMQWVMGDWQRVRFFNRWLAGTVVPRIQLDFMPGICCAAHFVLRANIVAKTNRDFIEAGRAMQRVWLTAASLGLQMQPEMTPLIFSWYAAAEDSFSVEPQALVRAKAVRQRFVELVGEPVVEHGVFVARIGRGEPAASRSLRKPLEQLFINNEA